MNDRFMPDVDRVAASRAAVIARRARAQVKSQLAEGIRTAVDVFTVATIDPESVEARLRVTEFLGSIPGIGAIKTPRILESLAISPRKRIGALGSTQALSLAHFLRERAKSRGEHHTPRVVVLAGPTAVGKGTVVAQILSKFPDVHMSISATTREPRPGEVHGVNYFFVSSSEFDRLIAQDELLEWAVVHGTHRYGTPRGPIENALAAGNSVLLEIDIQGARQVKDHMPAARTVFLSPPSWEELARRLEGRGTEELDERLRRLETAREELAARHEFDVRVVNDDVNRAAQQVVDLMGLTEE
jgi:guanylate kinase